MYAQKILLALSVLISSSLLLINAECSQAEPQQTGGSVTKLVHSAAGYQLLFNGKPFFIKGAGGDESKAVLKQFGGNSFRTWGADGIDNQLEEAHKLGLGVTGGIWLGHKEQGFNYNDPKAVQAQFDSACATIEHYKNSPSLLVWAIGNEMEGYDKGDDPQVWKAVEAIAAEAKKIDPNHPTMTVIAEVGGNKVPALNKYCPDIDIVGINSYAGASSVGNRYIAAGGTKPYIITEFGPPGTWEIGKNAWGVADEPTSTEKEDSYRKAYEGSIASQPLCLGSYAFAWGHKQEATATWFGLFLPDDTRLGPVDTLSELWTGKQPSNLCPAIESEKLVGSDQVDPGAKVSAVLSVKDPQGDPLKVNWVLQYDSEQHGVGGVTEATPASYPDAIVRSDNVSADVVMPQYGGTYRLFAYVRNAHNGGAVANIPILVSGNTPPPVGGAQKATLPLTVYDDAASFNSAFVPSGYMGNTGAIKMDGSCTDNPHSGTNCIKVDYTAPDNWGGVVWQSPANDWGDAPGGWDLTGAKKLTFWARGAKGGETVAFLVGIIGDDKKFHDTSLTKLDNVSLTTKWTEYTIDLTGKDLSRIKTGFGWTLGGSGSPITFYLDDIRYE